MRRYILQLGQGDRMVLSPDMPLMNVRLMCRVSLHGIVVKQSVIISIHPLHPEVGFPHLFYFPFSLPVPGSPQF